MDYQPSEISIRELEQIRRESMEAIKPYKYVNTIPAGCPNCHGGRIKPDPYRLDHHWNCWDCGHIWDNAREESKRRQEARDEHEKALDDLRKKWGK